MARQQRILGVPGQPALHRAMFNSEVEYHLTSSGIANIQPYG
jgi:hypothetical protein